MRKIVFLFLIMLGLFSCSSDKAKIGGDYSLAYESEDMESAPITRMNEPAAPLMIKEQTTSIIEKKIIKDANIGVEVYDYKLFRIKLDSLVKTLNGYIANDNLYNNDESINCDVAIRIPEKNFDKFLMQLDKGTEKTLYKNISTRDITEEFIDIESRLNNKKSVEKRYAQLLSKARNVKDILEIEEKLRVIREEIESSQGRLNYLNSQVSFSTINLTIIQKIDYKYQPSKGKNFFQMLIRSLDRGWSVFLQFLLFVFKLWPFVIIIAAIIIAYFKFWKHKKAKKQKKDK